MSEKTAGQVAYETHAAVTLGFEPSPDAWHNPAVRQDAWHAVGAAVASHLAEQADAARAAEMANRPSEGWGVIAPGRRKAHYYRDGRSLCREWGFYQGSLSPDEYPSPDDCAACRKVLGHEKAQAAS